MRDVDKGLAVGRFKHTAVPLVLVWAIKFAARFSVVGRGARTGASIRIQDSTVHTHLSFTWGIAETTHDWTVVGLDVVVTRTIIAFELSTL